MNWVIDKIKEHSTHQGVIAVVAAAAVIWGGMALLDIIVWGALAWGIWNIARSEG